MKLRQEERCSMKILYITPLNPLDKGCGGGVRSMALRDALCRLGEVKTLVVTRTEARKIGGEEQENIAFLPFYSLYCRPLKWPLFMAIAVLTRLLNWGFPDKLAIAERMGISVDDYDVIVVRYLWCAGKLGIWKLGRCVVDVDDSPVAYVNANVISNVPCWARPLVRFFYVSWQYLVCRNVTGIFVSNPNDLQMLRKFNKNALCLPNVSSSPAASYRIQVSDFYLFCVGLLGFSPNYLGIDRFLVEEWPAIKLRFPDMTFKIAGKDLPDRYREKWQCIDGVELLGFVDDLSGLYAKSLSVVVPLWTGGGTSVKTIEALKYGCKVIATPVGARGLTDEQLTSFQVDVVHRRGDFVKLIEHWTAKPEQEQIRIRESILRCARDLNSKESFDNVVEKMLREGAGE